MYFFYLDESGDRNPAVKQDEPFVLVAVGMHEFQWRKFEAEINSSKPANRLMEPGGVLYSRKMPMA